jgi:hypothetical protein
VRGQTQGRIADGGQHARVKRNAALDSIPHR